jgi:tetratricopeptide (TPR) repeat protein
VAPSGESADRALTLSALTEALVGRFEQTGLLADLDDAVKVGRNAVADAPDGHPVRAGCLSSVGLALLVRFERTGDLADANDAVQASRDAVALANNADRPTYLSRLGAALRTRFERTGDLKDADDAVQAGHDAFATTPLNDPFRGVTLTLLELALQARFERTGRLADLDDAIWAGRHALAAIPAGHSERGRCVSDLGTGLLRRFERTGRAADLDDAIQCFRDALAVTPTGHVGRAMHLSNLGMALLRLSERTGRLSDLDDAIQVGSEAVAATPTDQPIRALYLSNLGGAMRSRFERTGRLADLDDAIQVGSEAVAATPTDHPDRALRLTNLGNGLWTRFERTVDLADADTAVQASRDAVRITPTDHPARALHFQCLGSALWARFERTGNPGDADEALQAAHDALAATPIDHPDRAMRSSNLGNGLLRRFERMGRVPDLEDAIQALCDALAVPPADHPMRAIYQYNLGNGLLTRFERMDTLSDLDEAIQAYRDALTTAPADHPDNARCLYWLGVALRNRFEQTEDPADLGDAMDVLRSAAELEVGIPRARLRAARGWGSLAASVGDAGEAMAGFAASVRLLPVVAWRGLGRGVREMHLAEFSGLASEAAAWALEMGQPELAVELLEQGRSVLWAQTLQTRSDLTRLDEAAPDLAARMDEIRAALDIHDHGDRARDATPMMAPEGVAVIAESRDPGRTAERQRRLVEEWDGLVAQARAVLGDETFLGTTPFAQLRHAAAGGPVVINVSAHRCDALIVTLNGVQPIPLPHLTLDLAIHQTNAWLTILETAAANPGVATQANLTQTLLAVLAWLWDTITEPVLKAIGYTNSLANGDSWPRVWWCPTGPLTLLPLHAAGHHRSQPARRPPASKDAPPSRRVIDRVVSSYTSTLSALLRARSRPAPTEPSRLLAVGMPTTPSPPGQPSMKLRNLPGVPIELDWLHARFPIHTRLQSGLDGYCSPSDNLPTREKVLDALDSHGWAHLACHGRQDPANPADGAIYLADGPLTVWQIAARNLHQAEVACLSACNTATGGHDILDEAIHLAAAMQLAGYRHVIATLWTISDTHAPTITDLIYSHLTAVHHAMSTLLRQHPRHPQLWAPWIHTGP